MKFLRKNLIIHIKNNMHILFTRPIEDCQEMILKFQTLGHNVSHLPLISIEGLNSLGVCLLFKSLKFTIA